MGINIIKNFFINKDTINSLSEEYQIPIDIDLYKQKINGILPPGLVDNINAYIKQYQPIIKFGLKKFKLTGLLSKITSDDKSFSDYLKTPDGIKASSASLPKTYNLTSLLLPIRNQGETNCCVAFSTAAAVEYKKIITKKYLDYLSPAFIYTNRNDPTKDEGMDSKESINIVQTMGVATEQIFPFSNLNMSIQPNVYDNAKNYETTGSYYITNFNDLKIALFNNGPVIAMLPVYDTPSDVNIFWKNPVTAGTSVTGYHCITIVGYDNLSERLIIRNSWGTNWGINGYQLFPYSDFNLIVEAWALLPMTPVPNDSIYLSNIINNNQIINSSNQIIGLDPIVFYSLLAGLIVFIIIIIIVIIIRYRQQNNNSINKQNK